MPTRDEETVPLIHTHTQLELQPLVNDHSVWKERNKKVSVLVCGGLLWAGLIAMAFTQSRTTKDSGSSVMTMVVETDYSKLYGHPAQLYPWVDVPVVEPHKTVTFRIEEEATPELGYKWEIARSDGTVVASYSPNTDTNTHTYIQYKFTELGRFKIKAVGASEYEQQVIVKYVRREITSMLPEDRAALLEAIKITYIVDTTEGQKIYGEKYLGAEWFTEYHNRMAGDKYCDHMHDGLGFVNSHAALTMKYEAVLQLIDPSVSMPYWDFTVQGQQVQDTGDMGRFVRSSIFSADYFGQLGHPEGQIVGGVFHKLKIMTNASGYTDTTNAWGMMRAPWNQNNSPYVTRFPTIQGAMLDTVPGCKEHFDLLTSQSLYKFAFAAQYEPHGMIHTVVGGVGNILANDILMSFGVERMVADSIATSSFIIQKNMWRMGLIFCPTYCPSSTSIDDCRCVCPTLSEIISDRTYKDLITLLLSPAVASLLGPYDDDVWVAVLRVLCNDFGHTPMIGDMLESAAPGDPVFWPIHPTMERLYMWWQLNKPSADMTWLDGNSITVNGIDHGSCEGHNLDDVLMDDLFLDGQGVVYSNREIMGLLNPTYDKLPFVYDNFQWEHCVASGYSADLSDAFA